MADRRVLITGGSGFVGTNLIDHVRSLGWEAHNFDIAPPRNPAQADAWSRIDLLDRERLIGEIRSLEPHVILHFGARTDLHERKNLAGYAANIHGVLNLMEAVRATPAIKRIVVASTQLVCPPGYAPRADDDYRPTTVYGHSKVLTERIVRAAGDIGATWTIVRPTSLWGPWFGIPFRPMFEWIARNRYVHPAGITAWKQWGYVGNAVFQVERLVEAPPELVQGKTFYLADYEPVELGDFVERVRRALDARRVRTVPARLLRAAGLLGDVARRIGWKEPPISTFRYRNIVRNEPLDMSSIRELCGPLPFSVDEGIEATVHWLRNPESPAAGVSR